MTSLYRRAEIYKAGWVRGFYNCRGGAAGIPDSPSHDELLAEYWSGYFAGQTAGRGCVSFEPALPKQTGAADQSLAFPPFGC